MFSNREQGTGNGERLTPDGIWCGLSYPQMVLPGDLYVPSLLVGDSDPRILPRRKLLTVRSSLFRCLLVE